VNSQLAVDLTKKVEFLTCKIGEKAGKRKSKRIDTPIKVREGKQEEMVDL
jgi:hypothetical protein